ncbi:fimbria/pilus outer membrane usher protein [Janthinobacterium sp. SUN118]|uniref:fimbria/pilus outer membrane usher protein n=1 Tax=Janthinobacterium sp. SUN118 TaxID=3004100 RepID=UPI0025AF169E|nr:fimbria/pilus outer membrane usher protein [Janthinobacterium sp. SUN118]MDN2710982.1 fimbria/pilus outer membrane usher protein [Janthinobacterium sp. SUN118]
MKRALTWRTCWTLLLLAMVPLARADGAAASGESGADPGPARLPSDPAAPNELYLEVSVNAESTGLILRFTQVGKGLRSSVANLQQLGLDPARLGAPGQTEVALDAIPGLGYDYDAARQSISLQVADELRSPYRISARALAQTPPARVTPGAVLNYEAYAELGQTRRLALFNDVRYFNDSGVFSNTGTLNLGTGQRKYMRFDTFWSHADPDTLRTWQVGDLITSSLSWSRAVRVGGVQWRKNFQLRPDLLTFPVASVDGTALVPSSLSLYVNGVQQYAASVPSGPFVLNQVAGINGAGQATIITHDALGRSVTTVLPLYVDTRMLAGGLSDYSFEAGAVRRDYGTRLFGYERQLVASASGRYGVSDSLTVEGHAELAAGLYQAGAGVLWRLGQAGVLNGALSASTGSSRGAQLSAGYQYLGPRFSVDAQSVRASAGFGDLASRDGSPVVRAADRLTVSLPLPAGSSVSTSYISYRTPGAPPSKLATVGYSATLFHGLFFNASLFQDLRQRAKRGFYFGLSMAFDNNLAVSVNGNRQNGENGRSLSVQRTADFGGGFGWGVQAGTVGSNAYRQAQLEYLGNYGRVSARTQHGDTGNAASLGATGALVLMDGHVAAARQVGNGFALVSTAGVANIPVLHENRQIGVTGSSGYLLVPNLNPYGNNQISIATDELDVDARVPVTNLNVVPQHLAGVLAAFPIERYSAATIIIHDADGKPLAPGLPVLHVQSGKRTVVGFDGIAFVDDLLEENQLQIGEGDSLCTVRFAYVRPATGGLPAIGPLRCGAGGGR